MHIQSIIIAVASLFSVAHCALNFTCSEGGTSCDVYCDPTALAPVAYVNVTGTFPANTTTVKFLNDDKTGDHKTFVKNICSKYCVGTVGNPVVWKIGGANSVVGDTADKCK